jgi:D-amino peptidase
MKVKKNLKIYISVDIEGITGVIAWPDVMLDGKGDFEYFRKIMAGETNAAVEAAFEAGASEIIGRDAHGSALNILPSDLHKDSKLIRNWRDSPICMMDGIDASFDAVMLIGYHAKSGTRNATLKHTMTSKINELSINGVSLAEAALSALIAGMFDVPIIFIAGDKAICDYSKALWKDITTVAVKEGMGDACLTLHPEKSKEMIRQGVREAIANYRKIKPYKLKAPYCMRIRFANESVASRAEYYPGTERIDDWTIQFKTEQLYECFRCMFFCVT